MIKKLSSILVEPEPDYTDDDVVRMLESFGAKDVSLLSPGFIAASVEKSLIKKIEEFATVHVKAAKKVKKNKE